MAHQLAYWCGLYKKHKATAIALDIETQQKDGPISVVSLFKRPRPHQSELIQFINTEGIRSREVYRELQAASLILTFNGLEFDLPLIDKWHPGSIPQDAIVFDLLVFAKGLNLRGGLKDLEKVFRVNRSVRSQNAIGQTHRLWKQFREQDDKHALQTLLIYADEDVRNLFELADVLVEWADAKTALMNARIDCVENPLKTITGKVIGSSLQNIYSVG